MIHLNLPKALDCYMARGSQAEHTWTLRGHGGLLASRYTTGTTFLDMGIIIAYVSLCRHTALRQPPLFGFTMVPLGHAQLLDLDLGPCPKSQVQAE